MTGLRSGSADATLAQADSDSARPATVAASLVSGTVTIYGTSQPTAPPQARRREHQLSPEIATSGHGPAPLISVQPPAVGMSRPHHRHPLRHPHHSATSL